MPELEPQSPQLTIDLFGPLRVLVGGQPLPPLRSRKSLWLLALLVLRAGRPVERDWLAGTLWPDIPESRAASNLRVILSELRQALGSEGARLLSPSRHTLTIDLDGAAVNLQMFDLAAKSSDLVELRSSVALYRGPLLEGCTEEWVAQERGSREQYFVRALQTLAEAALGEKDFKAAAGHYRQAISVDPLLESAQRGLMQALSGDGDSNAAVQVYQIFARLLRKDDPKATPDEKTQALYTRLRTEARKRATAPVAIDVDAADPPAVAGCLPHPLTEIVGREDEREEVAARLRRSRLVTLTGLGGIGKTRLAIEVATEAAPEYADGAWLVALEALSDGANLVGHVSEVLRVEPQVGKRPLDTLTDYLRSRRLLLVLDNCEHLLDACARLAAHLLKESTGVRILATSREALGIAGETAWSVPGLAVPDPAHLPTGGATLVRVLSGYESIQLFVERAQGVQKAYALTRENANVIARICCRLEGIPLALELAAARVRMMTVETIEARLDDHLSLLTGGSRSALPRHQTLRAALDWSYDMLSDSERLVLARLSIFSGGCTLEAAEHVCVGDAVESRDVLDLMGALVDKSLIIFEKSANGDAGRYRLLETVRQYAAERLQKYGGAASSRNRLRDYYLILAERAEPELQGADQAIWFRRLEIEHDNLRLALASDDENPSKSTVQLRTAAALWRFWFVRGHFHEGRLFTESALAHSIDDGKTAARAKALGVAGSLANAENDYEPAKAYYEESAAIFEDLGEAAEAARILSAFANTLIPRGDLASALPVLERSLVIFRAVDDTPNIAKTLANMGVMCNNQGDFAAARSYYEESLALFEEVGDQRSTAWLFAYLGNNVSSEHQYDLAQSYYQRSTRIFDEIGDRKSLAWVINLQGILASRQDDTRSARSYHEQSVTILREINDRRALGHSLAALGMQLCEDGELEVAKTTAEESLSIFGQLEDVRGIAIACIYLGGIASAMNDLDLTDAYYRRSLCLSQDINDRETVAESFQGLGHNLIARGESRNGVHLLGAATALRQHIGALLPPPDQTRFDLMVANARATLGDEPFESAWAVGIGTTWEETTKFALAQTS